MLTRQRGLDMDIGRRINHYAYGPGLIIGKGIYNEAEIIALGQVGFETYPVEVFIVQFDDGDIRKMENPNAMEIIDEI
jgi:hypothetical protein